MSTAFPDGIAPNAKRLLWAGFMAILAAGVGFSVRGGILGQWAQQYGFTMTELGAITGGGLTGFGVVIILSSLIADKVGYGKLLTAAFLLHFLSAVITLATPAAFAAGGKGAAFQCLFIGMFIFALGNGVSEAVVNPLTATLFPKEKTHYLNILHAGWPAGLVLGGLAAALMAGGEGKAPVDWKIQMSLFLIPVVIYGFMLLGQKFPKSETSLAGFKLSDSLKDIGLLSIALVSLFMAFGLKDFVAGLGLPGVLGYALGLALFIWMAIQIKGQLNPSLLFVFLLLHVLVGYVELGTDSWIAKITGNIMASPANGLKLMVYTSALMFVLRFTAGPIVHRISPLGLLFLSGILGAIGLLMLGNAMSVIGCVVAVTIYALGKTFLWPTMLAVVSERYPRGGAVAIGMVGGMGMLSAGLLGGPLIGYKQDFFASRQIQETAVETYNRYAVAEPKGPIGFPKIKGLDGAKVGVLSDNGKELTNVGEALARDGKTDKNHEALAAWWGTARGHSATDSQPITDATLHGSRMALKITALVPAVMAVIYFLLIMYYKATGGYKPVKLEEEKAYSPS
jgi:MFS family permease